MMAQNQQKVKKEIIRVIQKVAKSLSELESKFELEVVLLSKTTSDYEKMG